MTLDRLRRRIAGIVLVAALVVAAAVAGAVWTTSAATAKPIEPGSAVPVAGTPCTVSAYACVDLDRGVAWLLDNGEIIRGPVHIVDGDGDTPIGTFAVEWKAEHWVSRERNTPMPWSVFFAPGGIAFHHGNLKIPSAGCVKLTEKDARNFYRYLRVGDEVQIHGTPGAGDKPQTGEPEGAGDKPQTGEPEAAGDKPRAGEPEGAGDAGRG